jgi:hypothetical protein
MAPLPRTNTARSLSASFGGDTEYTCRSRLFDPAARACPPPTKASYPCSIVSRLGIAGAG